MKLENKYAPAPVVTDEEVNEHACTLARQEGCRDGRLLNLIRWPVWASTPPAELLLLYGKAVENFRKRSRAQLEAEVAAQPRVRIKRYKRRKKPDRKKFWTKWPTKHGHRPPSRRRVAQPPIPTRQTEAPPGQKQKRQETPRQERPCRRYDREGLLLFEVTGISGTPDIRRFPNAL